MVDDGRVDGGLRHGRMQCLARILDDAEAATESDRDHSGRAVVECAGQDHADDPGAM
jgi:hypothetical protein